MKDQEHIFKKLALAATLLPPDQAGQPYCVPDDYFHQLPEKILHTIAQQHPQQELLSIAPTLITVPRSMPFALSENYFESINTFIPKPATPLFHIGTDYTISTPYRVEEKYFRQVNKKILASVKNTKAVQWLTWKGMAAAAILTGIVLSTFIFMQKTNREAQHATSLINLQHHIHALQNEELQDFVNPAVYEDSVKNMGAAVLTDKKGLDLNLFFKQVPSSDLKNFLDETGMEGEDEFILN